jgi:uncharacterized zinc-type alcohol dehydrogenase-like protein
LANSGIYAYIKQHKYPLFPLTVINGIGLTDKVSIMIKATAYGVNGTKDKFSKMEIERREVGEKDVKIKIDYCGICHSDIHTARNEWGGASYPVIPGHEIVGIVEETGSKVKKYKKGDRVGVGCMVDSDGNCTHCMAGNEHYCDEGIYTYNSPDSGTGKRTYGGYSTNVVVKENFVLKIPENLDMAGSAPLLCAGITTYSPLMKWNVGKGTSVAVAGLGGLGHMGVKIAAAMGADVTVITRSSSKADEAKRLGAKHVVVSDSRESLKKHAEEYDFILDTIPAVHDLNLYLSMVKPEGALVLVGLPEVGHTYTINAGSLIGGRKTLAGSNIGGIKETQEMLDFCGKHGITADIEMINADQIDKAYERTVNADVRYRFVIDINSMRK